MMISASDGRSLAEQRPLGDWYWYWLVQLPDGASVEVRSKEEAEAMVEEAALLGASPFLCWGNDGWTKEE